MTETLGRTKVKTRLDIGHGSGRVGDMDKETEDDLALFRKMDFDKFCDRDLDDH